MSTVRQDAWTKDEDLLLAEVVLRHIREGSTQLKAFEEVGKRLSRTPAACGFRWNSQVRKQYKSGIELAKKQRKELKKVNRLPQTESETVQSVPVPQEEVNQGSLSFDSIISYLEEYKEKEKQYSESFKNLDRYEKKLYSLETRVEELENENSLLKKENKTIKDDYLSLLSIMEKARKLAVREEESAVKVKFQMEKNGNLEAIKK